MRGEKDRRKLCGDLCSGGDWISWRGRDEGFPCVALATEVFLAPRSVLNSQDARRERGARPKYREERR
eukprot:10461079-Lingulodinium_polyedra.AAC.1